MIGISLDFEKRAVRDFVRARKIGWPQIVGEASGAENVVEEFGVGGVPQLFVVGPDGKIVANDLRAANVMTRIEQLFREGSDQ